MLRLAVFAVFLAGCSLSSTAIGPDSDSADADPDSASGDSGMDASVDAPPSDSRASDDSARSDSRPPDTTPMDSSPMDSAPVDTAPVDTGCADRDGDGVCDSADVCDGSDDTADVDGDGIPNGCDDCSIDGPLAPPIPTSVTNTGITITGVRINGGSNIATVGTGDSVTVRIAYEIIDCGCPGCIDQIEIGLVPDTGYQYCAYSAVPGCSGDTGTDTGTLTAPGSPGVYSLRFGRAQDFTCDPPDWWQGTPPGARAIGALCVR